MANSRTYVQESVADRFLTLFKAKFMAGQIGDNPLDASSHHRPQVDEIQYNRVKNYIEIGEKEGTLTVGGNPENGLFIKPTVFENTPEDARIMKEEIFGPVVGINTFTTEADAVAKANDTEFGLYASVSTKDIDRAVRMSKALEAGFVGVNCTTPSMANDLAFGGFKMSGFGREGYLHSLDNYLETKSIMIRTAAGCYLAARHNCTYWKNNDEMPSLVSSPTRPGTLEVFQFLHPSIENARCTLEAVAVHRAAAYQVCELNCHLILWKLRELTDRYSAVRQKSRVLGILQPRSARTFTSWDGSDEFFKFKRGGFLWDEKRKIQERSVKFDVDELARRAAKAASIHRPLRCKKVEKLKDGLNGKILSFTMNDGTVIAGKALYPCAGRPREATASEAATMEFVSAPLFYWAVILNDVADLIFRRENTWIPRFLKYSLTTRTPTTPLGPNIFSWKK